MHLPGQGPLEGLQWVKPVVTSNHLTTLEKIILEEVKVTTENCVIDNLKVSKNKSHH